MKPSRRLDGLGPSPIRKISDHAPPDAIPLGLGAPTWSLPEAGRQALAAVAGTCPYGPNAGTNELRAAIGGLYGLGPENVITTVGSQEALFSLFLAFVDPGDTVLIPDPAFPAYRTLAGIAGAKIATFALREAGHWQLDPGTFEEALVAHPGTKIAIINHPGNPTGGGASAESLRKAAALCEARDVLLISDEVYRDLYFGGRPASLLDVAKTGIVVSSVSKGWGSPGLRVGWIAGDPKWLAPATLMHNYAVTSAAWPSQAAALALIRNSETVLAAARNEVATRFSALARALKLHLGIDAEPPSGSFYYWTRLPPSGVDDPFAFCVRLRDEAKVVIIPGTAFGPGGAAFARISFAATPAQVEEGIRRLAPYWR